MNYTLECELEDDGRWIAEVVELNRTGFRGGLLA